MNRDHHIRRLAVAAALTASAVGCLVVAPRSLAAQVGAIGAVPGGSVSSADALAGTPILVNSALLLPAGRWGLSAMGVVTTYSDDAVDYSETDTHLFLTAARGLGERAMVGVQLNPYGAYDYKAQGTSTSDNGMGDAILFGKVRLRQSGATSIAAVGSVSLPLGDPPFGSYGAALGFGGVVTHRAGKTTWHGEAGFGLPLDDQDGETTIGVNGAAVYALSPRSWLSGELLFSSSDGNTRILGAPGVRFAVGAKGFIDVAYALELSGPDNSAFTGGLLLGFQFVP